VPRSGRATTAPSAAAPRATTGTFTVAGLPAGDYVVEIEKPGFGADVAIVNLGDGTAKHDVELGAAGVRESVVVTASGLPQSTLETSKAVSVIDAEEITARNAVTLADVVRLTPGVQVRDAGGPGQLGTLRIAACARRRRRPGRWRAAPRRGVAAGRHHRLRELGIVDVDRVEVLRGSASSLRHQRGGRGHQHRHARRRPAAAAKGSWSSDRSATAVSAARPAARSAAAAWLGRRTALAGAGRRRRRRSRAPPADRAASAPTADAATSLGVRIYGLNDRVRTNASPTASGVPAANIPDTTIVDAIAIPIEELERANAGLPFAFGDATFVPGRNDPDNDRASHFLTTAITLRRVESDRASWQASYQRVRTFRRYDSGPLGPGFQTSTLSESEFDGSTDMFEARGHLQPASWLTLTAGYEFEREHYGDLQDDNAAVAPLQTTTSITQTANAVFGAGQFALLDRRLQIGLAGRLQAFRYGTLDISATGADHPHDDADADSPPRALTGDVSVATCSGAARRCAGHAGSALPGARALRALRRRVLQRSRQRPGVSLAYGDPRLRPDRLSLVRRRRRPDAGRRARAGRGLRRSSSTCSR
jgi:hypothetical protein